MAGTTTTTVGTTQPDQSTTIGQCQKPGSSAGGTTCAYITDGTEVQIGDPCCSGSECMVYGTPTTGSYYKYCMQTDPLQKGDDCANKVGKCGPNLSCDTEEEVCKPEDEVGCQEPGNALCKIMEGNQDVGLPCCPGSVCLPWAYGTPHNYYCQTRNIAEGESCGDKVGYCAAGLFCNSNVCSSDKGCLEPADGGAICWESSASSVQHECCPGSSCDFDFSDIPDIADYDTMYCMSDKLVGKAEACMVHGDRCEGN